MRVFIRGDTHDIALSPDLEAMLNAYASWPRWRRWLWRKGWIDA